jgi:hypothetical protein
MKKRPTAAIAAVGGLAALALAGVWAAVSLSALGVGTGDTCDWVGGAGNSATVVMTIPAAAPKQGGAAFGAPGGLTVTSASFAGITGTFGTSGLPPGTSGENLLSGSTQLNPSGAATVTAALGLSGPAPASGNFTVVPTNSPPSDYYDAVSCGPFATSTSTTTGATAGATPHVSNVDPSTGVRSGGTNVTISGSGFTGASSVRFGTADATSFSVVSDTQITAVVPGYDTTGTVPVHVIGPGGHSQNLVSGGNGFKYTNPPKTTTATTSTTTTPTTTTTTTASSGGLGPSGDTCQWAATPAIPATPTTPAIPAPPDGVSIIVGIPAGAPSQEVLGFGPPTGLGFTSINSSNLAASPAYKISFPGFTMALLFPAGLNAGNGALGTTVVFVNSVLSGPPGSGASFRVLPTGQGRYDPILCTPLTFGLGGGSGTGTGAGSPPTVDMTSGGQSGTSSDPVAVGLTSTLPNFILQVLLPGLGGLSWSQAPSTKNGPRSTGSIRSARGAAPLIAPGLQLTTKAGKVGMVLHPTAAGKALLKAKGSFTVRLQMTFTPAKGKPVGKVVSVTLTGGAGAGPVARITSASVTTRGTARNLVLKLHVAGRATAKLILRATGASSFTVGFTVRSGPNAISESLPNSFKGGKAQAIVVLTDAQHRTRRYTATVLVPAAPTG